MWAVVGGRAGEVDSGTDAVDVLGVLFELEELLGLDVEDVDPVEGGRDVWAGKLGRIFP